MKVRQMILSTLITEKKMAKSKSIRSYPTSSILRLMLTNIAKHHSTPWKHMFRKGHIERTTKLS